MYLLLIFIDPLIFSIYYPLQLRQKNAPAAKQSSINAAVNRESSTDKTEGSVITVQEELNAVAEPKSDKWLNETILTNGQFEVHPEHCRVHTVKACASEDHFLPLDNEKAEVTKVEQKRDQQLQKRETFTAKDLSIGKVEEVTPIVTEICIPTTEDWEAETIDVPVQPVEQKPSEEWVRVNPEDAASVEPAAPEEKAMIVASKSEADEQLKEKVFPEVPVESHPEQSKAGEEKADTVEEQLPSTSEQKTETAKAGKRDQPPVVAEEDREEGEISSEDDAKTVQTNEGGHIEQESALGSLNQYVFIANMSRLFVVIEYSRSGSLSKSSVLCCSLPGPSSPPSPLSAGGRKMYSRDQLLSLRFLKECLEPPEGLFLNPGAIGLVKRVGGDLPGPMGGGVHPRDDRHTGPNKKVCAYAHMWTCVCVCVCVCIFTRPYACCVP